MRDPETIARSYLGTPFVHQGRKPGVGLDCAGLIIAVARELGLVAPTFDVSNYAQQPDQRSIVEACDSHLVKVNKREARPSDVIVIAWDRWPQHLGIMGTYRLAPAHRTLIHAFMRQGEKDARVVEHRLTPDLMRKIVCAYRFPEPA